MVEFSDKQIKIVQEATLTWDDNKVTKRATEELLELSTSLLHLDRGKCGVGDVLSEMADVRIVLLHLELKYGSYQTELNQKMKKAGA